MFTRVVKALLIAVLALVAHHPAPRCNRGRRTHRAHGLAVAGDRRVHAAGEAQAGVGRLGGSRRPSAASRALEARGSACSNELRAVKPGAHCATDREASSAQAGTPGPTCCGDSAGLSSAFGRRPASGGRRELAEVAVDHAGALAALVDRPHDERLAAARVAGGEDALDRGRVRLDRLRVAALVLRDAELRRAASCSGCRKPIASSTRSALQLALGARRPA